MAMKKPAIKEVPPSAHDAELPVDDPQMPFQGIETTAGQIFAGPLDDEEPGETGVTLRIVYARNPEESSTHKSFILASSRFARLPDGSQVNLVVIRPKKR